MRSTLALASAALLALGGISHGTALPGVFTVDFIINGIPLPTATESATGMPTTFIAVPSGGTGGITYQWDFGDGTVTPFDAANAGISHTYSAGGHYTVRVNAQDILASTATTTRPLTVHYPISAVQPKNSSTILLDSVNHRVWCVNVDQDTVTAIDATTNVILFDKRVGKAPRTLAQAADGSIWVVSQQHPSITVLDPLTGALQHVVPLPHGSLPYGICMTPDGTAAYVSFQGSGGVKKISTSTRSVLASSAVPASARGISVSSGGRVFVTRFNSPQSDPLLAWNSAQFIDQNHGEVVELNSSLGLVRTIKLVMDPGPGGADPDYGNNPAPSAAGGRGVPNYITSMVITPDGRRAWVPSKKDNLQRGSKTPERDGLTPSAEVTYRAIVSSLDLTSSTKTTDEIGERVDIDNSEMPQAACTSPLGDLIFIALQGNNRVQVRDLYDLSIILNGLGDPTGTTPASADGLAPQGLVLDAATSKLFVHNYMGRSISVFDAGAVLGSNGAPASLGSPVAVVSVVPGGDPADLLMIGGTATINALKGKRVFYNAEDPRMSRLGYISCAGCHLDGGSDMRVLDFTNRGEGFRNTVMLQGRGGTGMGNVHWSANFNEIQDFDNDVFARFHDGAAFALPTPPSFTGTPAGSPNAPLDALNDNAGRDDDLDSISAYVSSLTKVSRSPFRKIDGTLTAQGAAGEALFKSRDCQLCHKGRNFTDSKVGITPAVDPFNPGATEVVLHNVGTIKLTSGSRLGGTLPGIDTPTLKGLWQTAPYLHDGSAATIADVMAGDNLTGNHFGLPALTLSEQADLARYMLEIDEIDTPPVPAAQVNTLTLGAIAGGRPYSLATAAVDSLAFVDRSYQITVLPAPLPGKVLLRSAEDDKKSASGAQLSITLTAPADVYVFYDSRAGLNKPTWLDASWIVSPAQDVTISSGIVMNAYKQSFPAGTVTLGGNLRGGNTGALRNYFVIIDQAAVVFEEGPISKSEWVHDRDADGDGLHDEFEALALLDPFTVNTGAALVPDEDALVSPGLTQFSAQASAERSSSDGGGGGCGFTGLESVVLLALAGLLRKRLR